MLRKPSHGFTLLELLVVVILISIFFTLTALSIRDSSQDKLEDESLRFKTLIQMTKEKALFENLDIGIHFFEYGYGFIIELEVPDPNNPNLNILQYFRLDHEHGDKIFRVRVLDDTMRIFLSSEENTVPLKDEWPKEDDDEIDEPLLPHIVFYSSGENTPFTLDFNFKDQLNQRIKVDSLGKVEIESVENL